MFPTSSTFFRLLPLALALATALPAAAQSLTDLYGAARSFDASYQSAKAQFDATVAKAEQSKAALLPTVGLTGSASQTNNDIQAPSASAKNYTYTAQTLTLAASQPLYRPANKATYDQGQRQLALASVQLQAAEQDLMVRVSQAYFDVLTASDSLSLVQTQKTAVAEQLASAKRNFEVGTATITDTREAQARFDLVLAQEIAAENDLRVKRLALNQLVGAADAQPKPIESGSALPEPGELDTWTRSAQDKHPTLEQLRVALDVAKLETSKAQAGHKPTLDLTGSYTANATQNGSSSVAAAIETRANVAAIGLSLSIPLYAGNSITNRVRETVALEEKARNDLEAAQRSITQGTRAAFFGVQSGLAQIKALEAAEASSQSALDANKLGYQVGVRINIDVLNSQSQLFDTKTKLAKARYDVLLGGLKLRQSAGVLQADDLSAVSKLLAP